MSEYTRGLVDGLKKIIKNLNAELAKAEVPEPRWHAARLNGVPVDVASDGECTVRPGGVIELDDRVRHKRSGKIGIVDKVGACTYGIQFGETDWASVPHEDVELYKPPVKRGCNHDLYLHKLLTGDILEGCTRCKFRARYVKVSEKQ